MKLRKALLILAITMAVIIGTLYWKFDPTFELRGYSYRTLDRKTYLVVVNDGAGSNYRPVVDGKDWSYPLDSPGSITPGIHTVDQIGFEVRPEHVFYFNYWGP
jgi:hypothetical protein